MNFKVENAGFSYKSGERRVLDKISFEVSSGSLLAILGPNGAGKTTLLRCAMGFLKWSEGRTLLDGRDLRSIPRRELWQTMAYVPQARGAVSPYTAQEMILLGRSSRFGMFSKPGAQDIKTAEEIMERLGISRLRGKRCSEISGGELQMVLIARALAAEPQILILDEPESNLDFKNQLLVMETISRLSAQGMICIFNTHYPAHALQRADKALLLSGSGESLFGAAACVVTQGNIEKAFGVKAVIGEIEAPGSITKDIIPVTVSQAGEGLVREPEPDSPCLATVCVIAGESVGTQINSLLHEYNEYLVGRMGMPYKKYGVSIINLTMDAPQSAVRELTRRLSVLPGVSVKATFAETPPNTKS